ncbi:S8 family peptidase [Cytobacillus horneckiae]|uniref:Peptidase S8/S53 domain-containing protein n=1 Tax=Cytobacillus horneckiae TaxID=549687 RepID=A0A2N0ZIZ1_9BACI|nr:S8 family peptidase [Cytobacillus horneckiae]MEC1158997.1 S8 family peptidase [Cytobacillus horneckiae]MED2937951.1 S8 family peptidase [Cytobacillus horneckiae]PKG29482.1 hypothetical protein CWS20_08150 [Cytobacillus horneckiae]
MEEKPLLMLPTPTTADRARRNGGGGNVHYPPRNQQINRITPKFQRLESAIARQNASFRDSLTGVTPEHALVFETVGTIEDFVKAVNKIDGLEWLIELQEYISPDDDFYEIKDGERNEDKELSGRLFLIMSDQQALRELKSLWDRYRNGEAFVRGYTKFRDLFSQLKDIRLWDVEDRFFNTGLLEDWEYRLKENEEIIRFEVELWYRSNQTKRQQVSAAIRDLISRESGRIITESVIEEIAYHALLVEAPIGIFEDIQNKPDVSLVKADSIMYFRPVGQSIVISPDDSDEIIELEKIEETEVVQRDPIIALLDGLPLQNHSLLKDRLIIDDPDGYEEYYQANERIHGTSMASLIIHGELDSNESPIPWPIYIRPIMRPNPNDWMNKSEHIPEDVLLVDLIHRAVKRIFEGDGTEPPAAPNVKVINISIGDLSRPFDLQMSPWARLLDYLSYKYNVLFLISTGNYTGSMTLDIARDEFQQYKDDPIVEKKVLENISNNILDRRILSPSESMNSITIGASHTDESTIETLGRRVDLMKHSKLVSPISRVGLGYRNSIKPDLLFPGGRQLYVENVLGDEGSAKFDILNNTNAPGQRVAFPGKQGKLTETIYTRGTSNANALATRMTAKTYMMLEKLRENNEIGTNLTDEYMTLMLKTLLVHGASWGQAYSLLEETLRNPEDRTFKDKNVPRYLGYGFVDGSRVLNCTDQRITLLGFSKIKKDEGQIFNVPLPPSLSSKSVKRRLTVSLSWFTPINANNLKYRQAQLWFNPPGDDLLVNRLEADWQAVQRGTVQHEILEGDRAAPFLEDASLGIKVSCREDAGGLGDIEIPYTLAVTLEVAEGIDIPIYNEIREKLRTMVNVQAR